MLLAATPTLGVLFSSLLSPLLVGDDVGMVKYLNMFYGVPSMVAMCFCLIFFRHSRPPSPPSRSAEAYSKKVSYNILTYLTSLKDLLRSKTVLGFIFFVGTNLAILDSMIAQLAQIMCSTGYSANQVGVLTGSIMIAALTGSIIISLLARRLNEYVGILKITYAM